MKLFDIRKNNKLIKTLVILCLIFLVLFVFIGYLLFQAVFYPSKSYIYTKWFKTYNVSIFLNKDIDEAEKKRIEDEIKHLDGIENFLYESPDQGLEDLLESENLDDKSTLEKAIETIGENPLGGLYKIDVRGENNCDDVEKYFRDDEYVDIINRIQCYCE